MRTRNLKEQGITLVALVVTIIILLILAGVTINIALRENGLFRMARTGTNKYEQSAVNEQTDLDKITGEIANIVGSGGSGTGQVVDVGEITKNLKNYQGKYVDIGLDTNENGNVDDWELFYAGNNRIFLIAADYVPTDTLENAWGVIGSDTKLDGGGFKKHDTYQYSVRWSSEPTKFFDKLADLSLVKHTQYNLNSDNNNSKAVSQLLDTEAWSGIKRKASKNDCIDFVIGGPTLEMWCAAWKEAIKGDTNGFVEIKPEGTNANGYYVSSDQPNMQNKDYLYMNGTQTSLGDKLTVLGEQYKTFFPHTSEYEYCDGYWLAVPSASTSNYLMRVRCLGLVCYYHYGNNDIGVRPVVCLASGVQLTETTKGSGIYNVSL